MSGIFRNVKGLDPRAEEPKKETNMSEAAKSVANDIFAVIKGRTGDFLDANAAAKAFVQERSERLGKLIIEYKLAQSDTVRQEKKDRMELVQSTIETELAALALSAQTEARGTFEAVVKTAFDSVIKVLPTIIAAI
jgi:hypothetical protein